MANLSKERGTQRCASTKRSRRARRGDVKRIKALPQDHLAHKLASAPATARVQANAA
jgi:hypothetical protein